MLEKLRQIEQRYIEIEQQLSDPNVFSDMELFKKLGKEQKTLTPKGQAFFLSALHQNPRKKILFRFFAGSNTDKHIRKFTNRKLWRIAVPFQ